MTADQRPRGARVSAEPQGSARGTCARRWPVPIARKGHAARTHRAARYPLPAGSLRPASAGPGLLSPPRQQAASYLGSAACSRLYLRGGGGLLTRTRAAGPPCAPPPRGRARSR